MDQAAIEEVAQLFIHARNTGARLDALPARLKPANFEDSRAIMAAVEATMTRHASCRLAWRHICPYRPQRQLLSKCTITAKGKKVRKPDQKRGGTSRSKRTTKIEQYATTTNTASSSASGASLRMR